MADEFQGDPNRPVLTRRNRRRSAFPPVVLLGVLVVIAAVAAAGWFWLRSREDPEPIPSAGTDTLAPGRGMEEEPFVLPRLGASDEMVRRLTNELASHPRLVEWLVTDDLIRRFVKAVVDVSRGSSPVPALEMLIPDQPYTVRRADELILTSPESHARYDALAEVFTSVDPADGAEVYRRLLPLFREAYQELALPEGEFEEVLTRAIRNLLDVNVPERPLELREAVGRYVYVEEGIEALTPAQKHMIRMGPENARQVQEKLRELAAQLELPLEAPPGG
jgi:hypothetical protein